MAFGFERRGGLRAYKDALWNRLAFAARYGNQSLESLLHARSADLDDFNQALNRLITEENKTT